MDKLINAAKDYLDDDKDKRQGMLMSTSSYFTSQLLLPRQESMMPLIRPRTVEGGLKQH